MEIDRDRIVNIALATAGIPENAPAAGHVDPHHRDYAHRTIVMTIDDAISRGNESGIIDLLAGSIAIEAPYAKTKVKHGMVIAGLEAVAQELGLLEKDRAATEIKKAERIATYRPPKGGFNRAGD